MKRVIPILILAIVVGMLAYLYTNKLIFPKYSGPVEKITIGQNAGYPELSIITQNKGYFAKNGLDVTFKIYDSPPMIIKDLLAGKLDVISASAEFLLVRNTFGSEDIKILATVAKTNGLWILQARKDKGIQNISDLKGKKIGLQRKTINEFLLGQFLGLNGLNITDVQVVDLDLPTRKVQLVSGELDAIISSSPDTEQVAKILGDNNTIQWPAQGERGVYNLTYSTGRFIKDHESIIERYLRATIEAENFVKNHNREARSIMQDYLKFDDANMAATWPKLTYDVSLDQGLLVAMEDEARWSIENKLTPATKVPNYLDFIYFDALKKVKPEAITIIH